MAKRESYINGVRMYSDIFDGENANSKKQVDYYKRVEKTMTKTVIKEGDNNPSTKVFSTTIIKKGNNPEQITKKTYSSNNYGSIGYEQGSRRFESSSTFKKVGAGQQISKKINTSNISNSKYTGLQPSSQTVIYSGNYKNKSSQQKTSQKIISTSQSKNNTYLANKGNANYGAIKGTSSYSSSSYQQKGKYTSTNTTKEKNNYNLDTRGRVPISQEIKETKVYKSKSVPKPKPAPKPIVRSERNTIRIVSHRKERTGRKEENYEYLESKDIKNKNKDTIVIHRKWGDPFYQIIGDKQKFSSYTSGSRGYKSNYSLNQKDTRGARTLELESEKYKYRNKTENKRGTIDTSKYRNLSSTNKYQSKTQSITSSKESQGTTNYRNNKNYGGAKYNSSYQRTINVEENRKKFSSKGRYEQSFTEGNKGRKGISYPSSGSQGRQYQKNPSSKDQKKNLPPSYKKFEEKTEESYKKGKRPHNQKLNPKVFDTQKYKRPNQDINKYQRNSEKTYKKEISSSKYQKGSYNPSRYQSKNGDLYKKGINYPNKYQQNKNNSPEKYQRQLEEKYKKEVRYTHQGMDDGQYPIDRSDKIENQAEQERDRYGYIQEQINKGQGEYGDEADNYKFYESKNVTRKVENMNIQNILRAQNMSNTGSEMVMGIAQGAKAIQGNQGIQGSQLYGVQSTSGVQGAQLYGVQSASGIQGAQLLGINSSSGTHKCDFSKVYIATRVLPVYSEVVSQYFQNLGHVCNVCGNPIEQGQGQIFNTQQISYENCPIHSQQMIQQPFSGY